METDKSKLHTLLRSVYIHEIELAKTLLSRYGIKSYILDKNLNNIIGLAIGEGYRLQVRLSDFEKAKEILESDENTD